MADHLHPAIDIPGGLWDGAPVRTSGGWSSFVWLDGAASRVNLAGSYDTHPVADLSLRLDDPLGLGLAGLAARVAERCGWDGPQNLRLLADRLCGQPWAPERWWDGRDGGWLDYADVIREAATLTARLDRLAAAVWPEYRVEAGRVPEWRRLDDEAWILTVTQPGGLTISASFGASTPDPIEAAGAALEVTCG